MFHTDLYGADLVGSDLSWAILTGANLENAILVETYLTGAQLDQANLHWATLIRANLHKADLRSADLRGALLSDANLSTAKLDHADLSQAHLDGANLVNASFESATLDGCHIFGVSAWNVRLDGATQRNLHIMPEGAPDITVDNLQVAQFLFLLLHNREIRAAVDTITSKVVLILGRFTPERKLVLDALREELRQRDYVPVLFDFPGPESRDAAETVTLLARMARFVVADLTDPSSLPLELQAFVPDIQVPVQCVILQGQAPFSMFDTLRRKYPWLLEPAHYTSVEDLLASLHERVIAPAERLAQLLAPQRPDATILDPT